MKSLWKNKKKYLVFHKVWRNYFALIFNIRSYSWYLSFSQLSWWDWIWSDLWWFMGIQRAAQVKRLIISFVHYGSSFLHKSYCWGWMNIIIEIVLCVQTKSDYNYTRMWFSINQPTKKLRSRTTKSLSKSMLTNIDCHLLAWQQSPASSFPSLSPHSWQDWQM